MRTASKAAISAAPRTSFRPRWEEIRLTDPCGIVCLIFAYQNFTGNVIGNQATYFFERESISNSSS